MFSYNLEDIDHTESGADIYNGQQSVLWINVRQAFYEDIKAMYQKLRSNGILSFAVTEQRFEEHQAKWPEAVFNEDAYFKYLQPLVEQNTASYLTMLQGSKAEQRKWWLYNRFRYLDSKYNAGDALTDVVTLRGYAKDDITVTPYADIYATVKYGSYLVQQRANRNVAYTLACPLSNVNDTEIYIYSASQLQSIGDLSGLMVGYADFSMATRLQSLKVGDAAGSYSNGNLTELYLGNNTLLRTLDVRNCPNLKQAVDVSGCTNIEHLYFEGTAVTGVQLPNGGILKTLHLPETVTNLTIRNQTGITDFVIGGYDNISTLRLENVSEAIDSKAILLTVPENTRVRLIGFNWNFDSAEEILALYDRLDMMRGLDESGNNVDTAQVSGTVFVQAIRGPQLEEMQRRYPTISVAYTSLASYLYYYDDTGETLLYTETVMNGGTGVYSGTPAKASTAQYTYTFTGWSATAGGAATSSCRKNITTDKNVYAAYSRSVRTYTVRFFNEDTLLQTVENVPYGSSATYTGEEPVSAEYADLPFEGWLPDPIAIYKDTDCYALFQSPYELTEITDDWATIISHIQDDTYRDLYKPGHYKALDMGSYGTFNMQVAAVDRDTLADGTGKAPITFVAMELLKSDMNYYGDVVKHSSYLSLMNALYDAIGDETVKEKICAVTKEQHTLEEANRSITAAVWIPSYKEVFGGSVKNETQMVHYSIFSTDELRIKHKVTNTDTNVAWALRSRSTSNINNDCLVSKTGTLTSSAAYNTINAAVCFGFCLGK